MNFDALKRLGLTNNEIRVYRTLLTRDTSTTGPLLHELGLSSSRIYASLGELVKKGLVSYFMKNNVRYYQAQNPEVLIKYAEEIKKQTERVVSELSQLKKKEESKDYALIFEGFQGFKQAFRLLLSCTPEDEVYTIGFMLPLHHSRALRAFLKEIDSERNRKKIPMKIILDQTMKMTIGKDKLIVSANSPSIGEDMVEIEAATKGEENEIAFNAKYLLDVLSVLDDEEVIFEMNGPLNPGIFRIPEDKNFFHLVMPIRVQG